MQLLFFGYCNLFCSFVSNFNKGVHSTALDVTKPPAELAVSKGRVYEKVLYHFCDAINITNKFEQTLSYSLKNDKNY